MGFSKSRTKVALISCVVICLLGTVITLGVYFGISSDPKPDLQKARPGLTGALVDYVYEEDIPSAFAWVVYKTEDQPSRNVTSYFLNFTSLRWMDDSFSDRSVWWHNLVIHIPHHVIYPTSAFLWVSHYANTDGETHVDNDHVRRTAEFAGSTGIPAACMQMVPNQPAVFLGDGVGRQEDDFIAWTWRKFYNDTLTSKQDPRMLAYFPMVKAVVRAMDAITEFCQEQDERISVRDFMIGGESKRGWTNWMVGAVDSRVRAMVPVVCSCMNVVELFHHYWRSFGGWPFAMVDYYNHGIMALLDEPGFQEIQKYVDPYAYIKWMDIPTFSISTACDEFFLIDDYKKFFHDLPGENYMWIMENSGHVIRHSPIVEEFWDNIQTFHLSVLQNKPRPVIDWSLINNSTGGLIHVTTNVAPKEIKVWSAVSNPPLSGGVHRRDWRRLVLDGFTPVESGVLWVESDVTEMDQQTYEAYFSNPEVGYLGFFVKIQFEAFEGREYIFSTEANILRPEYPFPECAGVNCHGSLV